MEEQRLQEELKRTRKELLLLYEIGNLIRTTLLLDEVTYLILSAVTSHEGLGFNRAIIFLVDDAGTHLEGKMGIGPAHAEAAPTAWKMIEDNKITLEGLLDVYHKANRQIDRELNDVVRQVRFPIEKDFGVLPKAVIQDTPYLIAKEDAGHEVSDMRLRNLVVGQFAVVPLRGKEHVIGALLVDNVTTKKKIEEADVRRLMMLANHGGLALENAKTFSDMVITSQQDSLTKLWNHGHFQKTLTEAIKESRMTKKEMSLVLFDVDDFKMYNDSFGHQTGDRALEFISRTAKTVMRRNDCLARYGGEEFAAIFPGTSREEALKMADRLRGIIEKETSAAWQTIAPKTITVSAGVATFPEDADEKEKLIYCADAALYEAKRSGKNQVRVYRKPN